MFEFFLDWFENRGLGEEGGRFAAYAILLFLMFTVSLVANWIAKRFVLRALTYVVEKSKTRWDDILLERDVFSRLSHLAPALVIYLTPTIAFQSGQHPILTGFLERSALVYMFVVGAWFMSAFLNGINQIYQTFEISAQRPIKGYIQALKIGIYLVVGILVISALMDQSPKLMLSGLGALTAVLLLVFKDSILGFVASIQLASNNMVRQGDWISVPKHNADGDVIDVSLTTVKVQNWDKTITTIPIYQLIADSFTNWRGMSESEGRRIKRSFNIEMSSIRFCDTEMLEKFGTIRLIAEYIKGKKAEIKAFRKKHRLPDTDNINGPQLTNIGTFRIYIGAYLRSIPTIHPEMTFLVRYLAPTPHGLPVEIYAFSKDKAWANYEQLQADIFDHLLAVAPEFGLRVFQYPSGNDLQRLALPMPVEPTASP